MKRILKWTAFVLASIVVVALLAIYGVSEYRLRQKFDIAATPISIPSDSASLARGQHVYKTRGCEGCHGPGAAGQVLADEPFLARLVAPNVPAAIRGYSDADLARLLRHGVRPNGRGVAVMPSAMLYHLDDGDLSALIAYLRTLPVSESTPPLPATSMRLLARLGLTIGQYKLEPLNVVHDAARAPNGPDVAAQGLYLAMTACTECHGQRLEGRDGSPGLSIVAGYSASEFARLMREGVPKDGREMPMMGPTARNRFANFTADEVAALYGYLSRQLAGRRN